MPSYFVKITNILYIIQGSCKLMSSTVFTEQLAFIANATYTKVNVVNLARGILKTCSSDPLQPVSIALEYWEKTWKY